MSEKKEKEPRFTDEDYFLCVFMGWVLFIYLI